MYNHDDSMIALDRVEYRLHNDEFPNGQRDWWLSKQENQIKSKCNTLCKLEIRVDSFFYAFQFVVVPAYNGHMSYTWPHISNTNTIHSILYNYISCFVWYQTTSESLKQGIIGDVFQRLALIGSS